MYFDAVVLEKVSSDQKCCKRQGPLYMYMLKNTAGFTVQLLGDELPVVYNNVQNTMSGLASGSY